MKTAYKFATVFTFTAAIMGVALTLPAARSAAIEATGACSTLPTALTKYETAATGRLATMNDDFAKRISNIANRDTTVDPKVAAARTAAAEKFDQAITKLKAQSGLTQAQQAAIDTYVTQMKAAEKTRETAVDAVRSTYRTSLSSTVQQHQAALTAAVKAFQSSVSNAFTVAIANCGNGTARATLKASIASAKAAFASERQSAKVTDQIKVLVQARDAAIKAADTAFANQVKTYSATLTAVLDTTAQ
jgi:hypothetical protein